MRVGRRNKERFCSAATVVTGPLCNYRYLGVSASRGREVCPVSSSSRGNICHPWDETVIACEATIEPRCDCNNFRRISTIFICPIKIQ